jgi:hypothetical protein
VGHILLIPHVIGVALVKATSKRNRKGILGVVGCVLVVAQELDLRASVACGLRSSGYAVELAVDEDRALRLASSQKIMRR